MSRVSKCAMWLTCALTFLLCSAPDARAVVNGDLIPCNDRRFDAVGLFITFGYGTHDCPGAVSGTCTLIDKDVVLIARHCIDGAGIGTLPDPNVYRFRVRFRRAENGLAVNTHLLNGSYCHGIYQEFNVVRFADITPSNGTDMVLGFLDRSPVGIRPIQPEVNNPPRQAIDIILAGWGYSGQCLADGDHWALRYKKGRAPANMAITDYFVFSPCALLTSAPCISCPPNLTTPYVLANLHDSGAPVLMEVPSTDPRYPEPELRLVGVVSTPSLARRPSAWNVYGGTPRIAQPAAPENPVKRVADFNCDKLVNLDDVIWFLGQFNGDSCLADINTDGRISIDDLLSYVQAYFQSPLN